MRDFKSRDRDYFIDFLPNEIFQSFTADELSKYSKYRWRHRKFDKKLNELEDLENQFEEIKSQLELKRKEVKISQQELLRFYDYFKHYDKKIDFNTWFEKEWRNKKKCLQNKSVKPTYRISIIIEYKFNGYKQRKRIHGGNWKSAKETLNLYENRKVDYVDMVDEDIVYPMQDMCESISRWWIYNHGFEGFHNQTINLKKVVSWFNGYETKHGKGEGFKWSSITNKHHFSLTN